MDGELDKRVTLIEVKAIFDYLPGQKQFLTLTAVRRSKPMTIKVIGAGFGRTGTLSLKMALEELGFSKCYHMIELLKHPEHVTFKGECE